MLRVWNTGGCRIATLAAAATLLSACASNYQQASSQGAFGYTDKPLPGGHFLVTFTGGQNMDLAEVRRNLRRHSAEVALREGYSHFVIFDTHNEAQIHTLPPVDSWNPDHGYLAGYINPTGSWTKNEPGWPRRRSVSDSTKTTRYTAYSEIILLKGEQAAKDPDAQSARDVLDAAAAQTMRSAPIEHLPLAGSDGQPR